MFVIKAKEKNNLTSCVFIFLLPRMFQLFMVKNILSVIHRHTFIYANQLIGIEINSISTTKLKCI